MPKAFRGLAFALALLFSTGSTLADDRSLATSGSSTSAIGPRHYLRASAGAVEHLPHLTAIDYGGFVWLEVSAAQLDQIRKSDMPVQEVAQPFTLTLGGRTFDPAQESPDLPAGLETLHGAGSDLHLVQMRGPAKAAWLEELAGEGLQVVQYIHPFTYVVWGSDAAVGAVTSRANVRWTGPFVPAYRLLPQHHQLRGTQPVRVLVYRGADSAEVFDRLAGLSDRVDALRPINAALAIATVDVELSRLADIARIPGVYSVQPVPQDGGLRGEMSCQVNVNNLGGDGVPFPGYAAWLGATQLSGAGVIIANVDSGIDEGHPDLAGRMLSCTGVSCGGLAASDHGTHTAGIMVADAVSGIVDDLGFLRGQGVAPGAQLVEQVYNPYYLDSGGMSLLIADSARNGALISGNSWGPSSLPRGYDADTMQVDTSVRDANPDLPGNQPMTYVLSIMNGNGGVSTQGTPDEAKNVISVGSTLMQWDSGAPDPAINDISPNSAHGPAKDGRKLPLLVAPGWYVDSTVLGDGYGLAGGTSMASPQVSGAVALFIEYFRNLPGYSVDPSPALIKAALLPVAHDLAGHLDADGLTLGHPFDSRQGWGRLDVDAVVNPTVAVGYYDNPQILDNTGDEWTLLIRAADPNAPVRIMLVWTDAPGHGLGGDTPAWNNDLDLIVEHGANIYHGNNFGVDGWSAPGGLADGMNNTEGVFLPAPLTGVALLRVAGAAINSDAIPGVGDGTDQDFAVVCYNCMETTGLYMAAVPQEVAFCAGSTPTFDVDVTGLGGFTEPVTLSAPDLPAGVTADFSVNPVVPPGSSVLTLNNTAAWPGGDQTIEIRGEHAPTAMIATTGVTLHVFAETPAAATLLAPPHDATDVTLNPGFRWMPAYGATAYTLEVAADSAFTTIVHSATVTGTLHIPASPLTADTDYYWRVIPENICGATTTFGVRHFRTELGPRVLVVDDDDNNPNVRADYVAALNALNISHDIWDTNNSDDEPELAVLASYKMVIWFTGAEFGGTAGPGVAAETALGEYLDAGGCLFLSSQDYFADRGRTGFMTGYLGVDEVYADIGTGVVTGAGSLFDGLGPFVLSVPYGNYADRLAPDATAEVSLIGDTGPAAISKQTAAYRTSFWGFGFESLPDPAVEAEMLGRLVDWCGAGNPPAPGDLDDDGDVDLDDFQAWDGCVTGPAGDAVSPGCGPFDIDGDADVDLLDFSAFARLLTP